MKISHYIFIFSFLMTPYAHAIKFCSYNHDVNYYPFYTVNDQVFFDTAYNAIRCHELNDSDSKQDLLHLQTNGFELTYNAPIFGLKSQVCGKTKPCKIPLQIQGKNLNYIHVSAWHVTRNGIDTMEGALNLIYR